MAGLAAEKRKEMQGVYAAQRQALERIHAERGVDVFVSPFDIVRDKTGTELSYCTWPEGAVAWLPRTDCIAFTGNRAGKRWYLIVPWDTAMAICVSAVEQVPDVTPERFRTVKWPSAEQQRMLAEVAVIRSMP